MGFRQNKTFFFGFVRKARITVSTFDRQNFFFNKFKSMNSIKLKRKEFFSSMGASIALGAVLLGSLVYFAGPWEISAYTRVLDLLIKAGIVKYDDRGAGIVEGVPNLEWYMYSQEYIAWPVVFLVMVIFAGYWSLKAWQFHRIALHYGIKGTFLDHARAYAANSLTYKRFTPLSFGEGASVATLISQGATKGQSFSTVFLFKLFILLEISAFALIGLWGAGWASWVVQLLWALVVFGILYWWMRPAKGTPKPEISLLDAAKMHVKELFQRPSRFFTLAAISLFAFATLDLSAYFLTTAFSSHNIILHLEYNILLMAIVAGYIARQIPLTPSGVGQFEWAMTASLFITGVGLPEAATVALIFSFFYYVTNFLLYLISLFWRGKQATLTEILSITGEDQKFISGEKIDYPSNSELNDPVQEVPAVPVIGMPKSGLIWKRGLTVAWLLTFVFFFDQTANLLTNFWLLENLNLKEVFDTNFGMGSILFMVAAILYFAGVAVPAFIHKLDKESRNFVISLAGLIALYGAYDFSMEFHEFLLSSDGIPFNETDPIFNRDIGFYIYELPAYWEIWDMLMFFGIITLISSIVCANIAGGKIESSGKLSTFLSGWIGKVSTTPTLIAVTFIGLLTTWGFWISRFDFLLKDNYNATVFTGASYADLNGFFSHMNHLRLTVLVALGATIALVILLRNYRLRAAGENKSLRTAGMTLVWLIGIDFIFALGVGLRESIAVDPDQPVIQLPYIQKHIDATRKAYGFDKIEEITFTPTKDNDPLPPLEKLITGGPVTNAPLWPTYTDYLEKLVDPEYGLRIIQTEGDNHIYGPTLETFQQKQKLRAYYRFLGMDALRYTFEDSVGNQSKLILAASVREAPILEPQPWLSWWGQRFMLFTHGHGLVTAPHGRKTADGAPMFFSSEIPTQTILPELELKNPRVYYGEGSSVMAFSNVKNLGELDYPTEQGRAEINLPQDYPAGIPMNSLLKRIILGWRSGEFFELVFSTIITEETRVHFYRQPIPRLEQIAPFLFFEDNPYPVPVDGEITWVVNAMAVSDEYPYSKHEFLGDKSISRVAVPVKTKQVNYIEDAVKATVNAATGEVKLHKIADKPLINSWANIYPSLFPADQQMPKEVKQQMVYPLFLFHVLFDDLYIYYHMSDAKYFFNMEDMWDDADDVRGPIIDAGKPISFSFEPFHLLVNTDTIVPKSKVREQFTMTMAFTPEGAKNLRAMPMVYQDGDDYGKTFVLQVPKGTYRLGPEQADAVIDQDPAISEKFSWWDRRGATVIRGHTSVMLYKNEVVYIEPVFIRSQQNAMPQLAKVIVVVRGHAFMGDTIQDAFKMAYDSPLLKHLVPESTASAE